MVQSLGDKLQSLKSRVQLKCHTNYEWICVTPFVYNKSVAGWKRIKAHCGGIWHDSNESLDLAKLHQEILKFKNAKINFDTSKAVKDILKQFIKTVPSWSAFTSLLSSTEAVGACVLGA